jgi:iron complex outermembrane receptor protein
VDRSPISQLVGDGHNYFRSKNEVNTRSSAVFGELYWKINEEIKLTAGGRYTKDKKVSTPYPSQLLLGYSDIIGGPVTGGSYARGYRADPDVKQEWDAFTGALSA